MQKTIMLVYQWQSRVSMQLQCNYNSLMFAELLQKAFARAWELFPQAVSVLLTD